MWYLKLFKKGAALCKKTRVEKGNEMQTGGSQGMAVMVNLYSLIPGVSTYF